MPVYTAFNCTIDSEIELPALPTQVCFPDITIRKGYIVSLESSAIGHGGYIQALGDTISIQISEVGRFQIRAGREIVVEARRSVGDDVLRVYIMGLAIGVTLMQRGFLTFHASAVAIGNRAIAFMGAKGSGKSTLTAFFCARGYRLLSEDLLALRPTLQGLIVWPGYPRLKLTDEAAIGLNIPIHEREPVFGKGLLRMETGFLSEPAVLNRIYLLEFGNQTVLELNDPITAIGELVTHWFGSQYGPEMIHGFGPSRMWAQAVEVAQSVPILRLQRPLGWDSFPQTLDLIEKDLISRDDSA